MSWLRVAGAGLRGWLWRRPGGLLSWNPTARAAPGWEHVFVSIKGSAGRWFEAAVQRGDLAGALSEAAELPRPLALGYALGLVVLFAEHGDPRHGVAAARWAARVALERGLEVDQLAELAAALSGPRSGGDVMRRELEELAGRYGVPVGALLTRQSRRGAG